MVVLAARHNWSNPTCGGGRGWASFACERYDLVGVIISTVLKVMSRLKVAKGKVSKMSGIGCRFACQLQCPAAGLWPVDLVVVMDRCKFQYFISTAIDPTLGYSWTHCISLRNDRRSSSVVNQGWPFQLILPIKIHQLLIRGTIATLSIQLVGFQELTQVEK